MAPPKDRGDNQVTGALLHKDTSLHALVERGGGLRVTLLTLRCGFTPAWSCEVALTLTLSLQRGACS